jgi:hypothetical protein
LGPPPRDCQPVAAREHSCQPSDAACEEIGSTSTSSGSSNSSRNHAWPLGRSSHISASSGGWQARAGTGCSIPSRAFASWAASPWMHHPCLAHQRLPCDSINSQPGLLSNMQPCLQGSESLSFPLMQVGRKYRVLGQQPQRGRVVSSTDLSDVRSSVRARLTACQSVLLAEQSATADVLVRAVD